MMNESGVIPEPGEKGFGLFTSGSQVVCGFPEVIS